MSLSITPFGEYGAILLKKKSTDCLSSAEEELDELHEAFNSIARGIIELKCNDLFTIEGAIVNFKSAPGKINLLRQIQTGGNAENVVSGVVGALNDMYGMVANSAMLAMYEGEDVDNFIFQIDDKIVCGSLENAHLLKDGDTIKAVVRRDKEIFIAEAIQRPADSLMWMPSPIFTGKKTLFYREMHHSYLVFSLLLAGYLLYLFYVGAIRQGEFYARDVLGFLFVVLAVSLGVFGIDFWTYKDLRPFANRAELIFKALDFPDPEKFDLMLGFSGRAFNYDKAIKKYNDKKNGVKPIKRKRR